MRELVLTNRPARLSSGSCGFQMIRSAAVDSWTTGRFLHAGLESYLSAI